MFQRPIPIWDGAVAGRLVPAPTPRCSAPPTDYEAMSDDLRPVPPFEDVVVIHQFEVGFAAAAGNRWCKVSTWPSRGGRSGSATRARNKLHTQAPSAPEKRVITFRAY